ncbi:MAG TPA: hypothetical protein PKD32_03130 [Saprospiraceae bacterium]|nr:hypothetical protein [Saprospiraceae bacterium]
MEKEKVMLFTFSPTHFFYCISNKTIKVVSLCLLLSQLFSNISKQNYTYLQIIETSTSSTVNKLDCLISFNNDRFDFNCKNEIAGNYFQVAIETTPSDASIGLMMKYKDGKFYCVDNSDSGIFLPRDVKDLKKINIAGDYALLVSNDDEPMQILYPNKKVNIK